MQKEDKKALLSRLHSHIQWKKQRRSEGGTFGIYAKGTVGGLKNGLQKSEEINVMVKKMCIPTKFFPSESCN